MRNKETSWAICPECQGRGKKARRLRKKVKLRYQRELVLFEKEPKGEPPARPTAHLDTCLNCKGSGLLHCTTSPAPDAERYPQLAIIGGGIGGVALAVACLHRGIPFTLYERDSDFDTRSQGYGLTLQQASRAIDGLGLFSLSEGVISTRHVVHTTTGKVVGEWGARNGVLPDSKPPHKRTNVHIARQSLRLALLEQLGGCGAVQWGHQLQNVKECSGGGVDLSFQVEGRVKTAHADLVVGADGIRSSVRRLLIDEKAYPLRYLDCIVILGICPLADIQGEEGDSLSSTLLDSATVFQTANGNERIYMMPYTSDSIMWQLSFPVPEQEAVALSAQGSLALKQEACRRCQWHAPIPQILAATQEDLISGYPVYDRAQLEPEALIKGGTVTLIGDAAHPMSPFKGQGANQALLDALALARGITQGCRPLSRWRETGLRASVLTQFESDMLQRSATKVQGSAEAAQFLHSDIVLHESDAPRGQHLKKQDDE